MKINESLRLYANDGGIMAKKKINTEEIVEVVEETVEETVEKVAKAAKWNSYII